jgi:signal peptidase II
LKRPALFVIITVLMLIVDQAVKNWVSHAIPPHGSIRGLPFPGFFEITLQYNEGIAFGFLAGKGLFLSPVAVAIAIGATYYSFKHPKDSWVTHIAMGLLASGALGNLYDRIVNGRVTDMFYLRVIQFPVFNVADSCITVATILLILTWFGEAARQSKAQPAMSSETPTSSPE